MIAALWHAISEGVRAAWRADDMMSGAILLRDFVLSRLLKYGPNSSYNRPRTVNLGDVNLSYRMNRGDLQGLREVFLDEVYACKLDHRPNSILDLGANIGMASLWFHREYGARSTQQPYIVCVEPDPENCQVLNTNLKNNGVNAKLVRAAAASRSGSVPFHNKAESNLGRTGSVAGDESATIAVPAVSIAELLDSFTNGWVDLVKMDIEGSEEELLSSHTDWLKRVGALIVEWHDEFCPSSPLKSAIVAQGFDHTPLNSKLQDNLSLFVQRRRGKST